jgi:simple sugar transport system ATP-binding protein
MYCLPEEPLKNTCVGNMSVAQNMAFRHFDRHPFSIGSFFLNSSHIRRTAQDLIKRYRVKTPSSDTPIRDLSGGNVQRAVLARELSGGVEVLVAANPCFGLDFEAAADIRAQIIEARNRGAAVLLVSEDLDEVFELSDRIVVMFDGKFVYETTSAEADIAVVGRHMAGHGSDAADASAPVDAVSH